MRLAHNIHSIPIAQLLGEAVRRISEETSVSSLFEIHPLSVHPDYNKYQNSIWQLMSNYLSEGKSLIQENVILGVKGINQESELICHDGKEMHVVSNSFNCKWE